jgi:hypothetical protein
LKPGLVGAGGFALVAVGGAVVMRLVALWAQTAAPKLPLGSAYGDEPEPVRARLRERVSSPCGDDGGVEPADRCMEESCQSHQHVTVRDTLLKSGGLVGNMSSGWETISQLEWMVMQGAFVLLSRVVVRVPPWSWAVGQFIWNTDYFIRCSCAWNPLTRFVIVINFSMREWGAAIFRTLCADAAVCSGSGTAPRLIHPGWRFLRFSVFALPYPRTMAGGIRLALGCMEGTRRQQRLCSSTRHRRMQCAHTHARRRVPRNL